MHLVRRSLVSAVLAAAVVASGVGLVGPASAEETPPPVDASPSASPLTESPSPETTSPAPTTTESAAADHSTLSSSPAFPVVESPSTAFGPTASVAPSPAPSLTHAPPSDGVGLGYGQVDDYLALAARRESAAAADATAQAALATARASVVALQTEQVRLALSADQARDAVTVTQATTDDVASQMYQQGDGGLGAIGTILTTGPDGFLAHLSNVTLMNDVATGVVHESMSARERLAMAEALRWAVEARLESARATEKAATETAAETAAALASIDSQLSALDIAPPQVAVGPDGCPTEDLAATLRGGAVAFGAAALCRKAVAQAATPQAALAITWAFQHLGASYACGGAGRLLPFRADCSSFVSRAYFEGAGLATAGAAWAPSTRDMVPWDGVVLDPHYAYVAPGALRAGDLVLYDTCPQGGCAYKHVVMYLGSPDKGKTFWMVHTNSCGDVAKVEPFWGFPTSGHPFLVARRVVPVSGEKVRVPSAAQAVATRAAAKATATSAGALVAARAG